MKKTLIYGVIALLGLSFSACHDDDPNYENVTPPEVAVAPNTLKGVVTDIQGGVIVGATVKLGDKTATTDNQGIYNFEDVKEGTYTISAEANGMVGVKAELVVEKSATTQHLVWNATLAKVNTTEVNVTVDGGGEGTVESEALKDNDEGKVEIKIEVPEDVVPEDTKISLTPIYTEESAKITRAKSAALRATRADDDESTMLIGATLSCSDPDLQLSQDVPLTFCLDSSVATSVVTKKYVNGEWVDAPSSVVDGNVVISAREFTSYGIFLNVKVSTKVSTESLIFNQSEWNNLYGDNDVYVGDATFSYKVGTQITSKATNKLEGLLIEHLSRLFGATVKEVQGSYPINVTLPIGTALRIKGAQEVTAITVSGNSKSVNGTSYGTTNVQVTTYNREHNGGGTNHP